MNTELSNFILSAGDHVKHFIGTHSVDSFIEKLTEYADRVNNGTSVEHLLKSVRLELQILQTKKHIIYGYNYNTYGRVEAYRLLEDIFESHVLRFIKGGTSPYRFGLYRIL